MRPAVRIGMATTIAAAAIVLSTSRGEAHKPITSPYTYNEDVFPLLRDRCGRCHVSGGVAPMSLMTHADTVPWGESIKTELLSGTMPPLNVDSSPGRFRNVDGLTAREMNVLLTWVTGGTPPGDDAKNPASMKIDTAWPLGQPDLTVEMPSPYTLAADMHDATVEFTLPTGTRDARLVRAVDVRPGAPSIVRWATIAVSKPNGEAEDVLGLWLPGDPPVPLDERLAFELPAGAEITLRVHYRKTWENERKEIVDRSTVGVYFAKDPATVVRKITAGAAIGEDMRALAIYPRGGLTNAGVHVIAERPDGSRAELIAFHPRADWARRYWFAEPIPLPRNTRISVTTTIDDEIPLLPLSVAPNAAARADSAALQLVLNVVPGR